MVVDFDKVGNSMPVKSPIKLAHVFIRTCPETYRTMVDFYKTFLGATATYEDNFISLITYDDEHHRIAIAAMPDVGPKDGKTSGLEPRGPSHFLPPAKALGIVPMWCVHHGPTISIYYSDPDGNRLETQVDTLKTLEEATAYMTTKEFLENPIGVDFDPEDFIQRLQNGVDATELFPRPNIGPRGFDTLP
ncbi:hypothetical protein AJ79_01703 [Helicocarpus griseus UAMH5409]|uniref:VOC domain-containing protein n=1 Tax=Helicocarpus griseus UAMH5409 TaxID=1447875 RepID=A0A2B7Y7L0_9EURO|nr:hypothetical protein AJ79_01703 [Helicocarpus griseus UAMH5409]